MPTPYSIIYADPPWTYRDKALAGNRGACCKYPVMSEEDIYSLPVQQMAAPDSLLFLWTTMPKLAEGLETVRRWGFEYKTVAFTWAKQSSTGTKWFWGMGRWTRANAEICLLGTRGKPKRLSAGVSSLIVAPVGRHSAKPPETRDRIVRLVGDLPRVELFAREATPGWDVWGNEVESTVEVGNPARFDSMVVVMKA